jgi:hypothetical protein
MNLLTLTLMLQSPTRGQDTGKSLVVLISDAAPELLPSYEPKYKYFLDERALAVDTNLTGAVCVYDALRSDTNVGLLVANNARTRTIRVIQTDVAHRTLLTDARPVAEFVRTGTVAVNGAGFCSRRVYADIVVADLAGHKRAVAVEVAELSSIKIFADIELVTPLGRLVAVCVVDAGLRTNGVHTNSVLADLALDLGAVGVDYTGLRRIVLTDTLGVAELVVVTVRVEGTFWRDLLAELLSVTELARRAVGIACAFWRRGVVLAETLDAGLVCGTVGAA